MKDMGRENIFITEMSTFHLISKKFRISLLSRVIIYIIRFSRAFTRFRSFLSFLRSFNFKNIILAFNKPLELYAIVETIVYIIRYVFTYRDTRIVSITITRFNYKRTKHTKCLGREKKNVGRWKFIMRHAPAWFKWALDVRGRLLQ